MASGCFTFVESSTTFLFPLLFLHLHHSGKAKNERFVRGQRSTSYVSRRGVSSCNQLCTVCRGWYPHFRNEERSRTNMYYSPTGLLNRKNMRLRNPKWKEKTENTDYAPPFSPPTHWILFGCCVARRLLVTFVKVASSPPWTTPNRRLPFLSRTHFQ